MTQIVRVFAVQDIQGGFFHPPMCAMTEGMFLRMMSDMVASKGHPYNLHPADYMMYEIGEYDELTGLLTPSQPRSISTMAALVRTQEG